MNEPTPQPEEPTPAQIAATIAVLGDDNGPVQDAARRRLLAWGDVVVPHLRVNAESAHVRTRARCRQVLRSLEVRSLLGRLGGLRLDRDGRASSPVLLEGALLLANVVRTFVPSVRQVASRLRREASALLGEVAGRSLPTCARLLAERLHDRIGLRGQQGHLSVEHVALDRVLQCGAGAPVALSLVYILVARWAGLSAAGVALPDHYLVRLHGPRPVLIDPFNSGRTITRSDCVRYLRANGHERVNELLRDRDDRAVLLDYMSALSRAVDPRVQPEALSSLAVARLLLRNG